MVSNSQKMIKIDRSMSELRQIVCSKSILTLEHLLVALCALLVHIACHCITLRSENVSVLSSCGPQAANRIFPITLPAVTANSLNPAQYQDALSSITVNLRTQLTRHRKWKAARARGVTRAAHGNGGKWLYLLTAPTGTVQWRTQEFFSGGGVQQIQRTERMGIWRW